MAVTGTGGQSRPYQEWLDRFKGNRMATGDIAARAGQFYASGAGGVATNIPGLGPEPTPRPVAPAPAPVATSATSGRPQPTMSELRGSELPRAAPINYADRLRKMRHDMGGGSVSDRKEYEATQQAMAQAGAQAAAAQKAQSELQATRAHEIATKQAGPAVTAAGAIQRTQMQIEARKDELATEHTNRMTELESKQDFTDEQRVAAADADLEKMKEEYALKGDLQSAKDVAEIQLEKLKEQMASRRPVAYKTTGEEGEDVVKFATPPAVSGQEVEGDKNQNGVSDVDEQAMRWAKENKENHPIKAQDITNKLKQKYPNIYGKQAG